MNGNRMFSNSLSVLIFSIFLFLSPKLLLSEDNKQPNDCLDQAINKIIEIRSLP